MQTNRTIPFMWIAFYSDNTCLPQFDLDTGYNHLFKEIDQSKLIKFGWFPIPYELSKKLSTTYYHDPKLPHFILSLKPNQRIIAFRTEAQHTFDFFHCTKCGFNWQWMPNKPDGSIGDSGLPRYGSEKFCYSVINQKGKKIFEVICPKCGVKNDLKCPDCDEWWNKVADEPKPLKFTEDIMNKHYDTMLIHYATDTLKTDDDLFEIKPTYHLECPKCKKINEKRVQQLGGYSIDCEWKLGWQETLPDGTNKKILMIIKSDGTFTLEGEC